ncbi:MAG: glycosyltransferase family 2 protein [Chromatiales bacterium]|jgi:glycosyltransferase involved in cell wall biosynthesis
MSSDFHLAVVIPALNEAATITSVIDAVHKRGAAALVVDDGSEDDTVEQAHAAGATVICHKQNRGYEAALGTGIEAAISQGYELAITFDADGQLDADDILHFQEIAQADAADIVVGIRDYRNRYSEYLLSLYGRYRFGLSDPLCGMKLYRLNKANGFLPFDSSLLVGMEMAFRMIEAGCSFSQVPIHVEKRIGISRYGSSLQGEMNILKALGRVIRTFGWRRKQVQ